MKTTTILRNVRRDPDLRRGVTFLFSAAVFAAICFAAAGIGAAAIRAAADHDMGLDQSMGQDTPYNPKAGVTPASQKAPDAPAVASGGWVPITFSVYSSYYNGRSMRNGRPYDPNRHTVASNEAYGKSVLLRVGDKVLSAKSKLLDQALPIEVPVTDTMAKRFTRKRMDLSLKTWNAMTNHAAPGLKKGYYKVVR